MRHTVAVPFVRVLVIVLRLPISSLFFQQVFALLVMLNVLTRFLNVSCCFYCLPEEST